MAELNVSEILKENESTLSHLNSLEGKVVKFNKMLKDIAAGKVTPVTADMPVVKKCVAATAPISKKLEEATNLMDAKEITLETVATASRLANEAVSDLKPVEKKFRPYVDLYLDIKTMFTTVSDLHGKIQNECKRLGK